MRPLSEAQSPKHPEYNRLSGLGIAKEDENIGASHDDE